MKEKIKKIFMSKKLIVTISVISLILLLFTIGGPYAILAIVRQPNPETHKYSEYFYTTYDEVRTFKRNCDEGKELWQYSSASGFDCRSSI